MKLRNKKTGEIVEITMPIKNGDGWNISANSLAEFNEDWEDYEGLKEYWYINPYGVVELRTEKENTAVADRHKQFGNYFDTREEAERAVEKLKAWKRLKDKGFKFDGYKNDARISLPIINWSIRKIDKQVDKDLDLLFGDEE